LLSEKQVATRLAGHALALHVNVLWLIAIEAVEKEPIGAGNAVNSGHKRGTMRLKTIDPPLEKNGQSL
jgi:hypothetical protein